MAETTIGYEETSDHGLIDTDERRTQEEAASSTVVDTVRGNVVLSIDGEDVQVAGDGVPCLSALGGEGSESETVGHVFVTGLMLDFTFSG